MLAPVLPPATAATPPPAPALYAGRTAERAPLRLRVRGGRVARVVVVVRRYACDPYGDIGPLRVDARPGARLGRGGRVAFAAGVPSERLRVIATLGPRRAAGRLRVRGTIGTGDPCASGWVRFAVPRR